MRENPVVSLLAGRFLGGAQQLALDPASLIDAKQVVFQTEEEIFCLPFGEGRTNPNPGERRALPERFAQAGKSIVQPPFQVSQPFPLSRASQCPNIESLESLPSALAFRGLQGGGHLPLRSRRAVRLFPAHQLNMKTLLTLLTIAILSAVSADAKTFKLPNEDFAIASIDMPDSWKPKAFDNGVAGQSSDDAVYISVVAVGSEKGMTAEIEDTFDMLKKQKVTLDESTKKENKFKIGAFDATELLYQGKDEDGPAAISICFVPVKDKLIIFTYWVTTAKEKEHLEEVGKIVNSLKASS